MKGILSFGQDPVFSHYCKDKLYLNPALAGADQGLYASTVVRYQWPGITSDFVTKGVSLSSYEPNLSGGIGVSFMENVEGEGYQKTIETSITYAYRIPFQHRRGDISFGLRGGLLIRSIDFSKLTFSDQYDPVNGLIYPTQAELPAQEYVKVFNANTGINLRWFTSKQKNTYINAGISASNITRPRFSIMNLESRLPVRYTIYTSMFIPIHPTSGRFNYGVTPLFSYTTQGYNLNGEMKLAMAGIQISNSNIGGGVIYRSATFYNSLKRESVFSNFGLYFNRPKVVYHFSYGYEVTISKLATNSGGTHEIALTANWDSFMIFHKLNSIGKRRLKHCPDFRPEGGLKSL